MEKKIFNAWLAGFWEGEGYIGKHKNQLGYKIEINQTLYSTRTVGLCMKKIQEKFGGYLHAENPKNKKHRIKMRWQLNKQYDVMQFVKAIYPYCQFRKEDLREALIYFVKHDIKKDVDMKVLKKLRRENKSNTAIAKILKISKGAIWYRFEADKCFNFWVNIRALQNILSSKI